jgi:hypothetical protein
MLTETETGGAAYDAQASSSCSTQDAAADCGGLPAVLGMVWSLSPATKPDTPVTHTGASSVEDARVARAGCGRRGEAGGSSISDEPGRGHFGLNKARASSWD